ncbi:hypothetical protein EDB19DRAFT_1970537 [Suillus lakei]|nr:hypothetical protein EDB19DRAFT_1970537 [Suillus lakei]
MAPESIVINGTDQVIVRDNVIVMDVQNILSGWPTYEINFTPENPGPLKLIIHLNDSVNLVHIEESTDSEAELLLPGRPKRKKASSTDSESKKTKTSPWKTRAEDKMLDSALDRGMPLIVISASPPESPAGSIRSEQFRNHEPQPASNMDDLLFEKTGHRTYIFSSDSVFGVDPSHALPQFKQLSSYSIASAHSPQKEDDAMISMLGGGHI